MTVGCEYTDGCPKAWPRDPALEVECPTCGAVVGKKCVVRRPSGHNHSTAFAGLPGGVHAARDLAADAQGCYGDCPLKKCGEYAKFQLRYAATTTAEFVAQEVLL